MWAILRVHDITVLELTGALDSLDEEAVAQSAHIVLSAVDTCDPPRLLFDLTGAIFIGSAAVELFVRAIKRIRQRGGAVALCCLDPFCREVIQVTRLDLLLSIYPDRAAAIDAMSATPCA